MPCAMSSLRGASGVVGCDRVVCPLVLHATTIAHLDVLLCTLVYSLVLPSVCCASVWCCAPVLWCALCLSCPARGASAWCCGCGVWVRPAPALPAPCWCVLRCTPCTPVLFLSFFLGIIPAPYMGVLYAGLIRFPIYVPYFLRLAIYDPFCTHSKSRPLDSECGFPKVGLNFRCSVFFFCGIFPVKFPA